MCELTQNILSSLTLVSIMADAIKDSLVASDSPKKSDWAGFGVGVIMAGLKAFVIGLVGGGFLFYSYADPLSNLYDADMPDPLLNLNVIAMLCRQDELKARAAEEKTSCALTLKLQKASGQKGGAQEQKGGAQPTQYTCRIPRSKPLIKMQTEPVCEAPYSSYPGRDTVNLMIDYSNRRWDKIGEDVEATRNSNEPPYLWTGWPILTAVMGFLSWISFWLPVIGSNGKVPAEDVSGDDDANKGGAFGVWVARTQALTWSTYRYILACIFTASGTIQREPSPFFQIQFFAYLYAGFMSVVAQTIIPIILPFVCIFYQLFDFADDCTNEVTPGLPLTINMLYCMLPIFSTINMVLVFSVLPIVGFLYFIYLIIFAPIIRDKKLYLSTLQCNQQFLGLVFATLVAMEGATNLDAVSSGAFLAAYVILFIYYLYSNKDWFKAVLSN